MFTKLECWQKIEGYKGQIDLVNAFSKLSPKLQKKFKVFFVGNGEKEELKLLVDLINKKNLKNTFKVIKFINEENLLILKNFDLLISLTRDFEGFGYSIAEALYVQTPVIATKVGGVGEFLNEQNSTLVRPGNLNDISNAIKKFYYKKSYIKKKSIKGKKIIIKNLVQK